MVEKGASERFDEILIEGRDSIRRKDLPKYIRSNFERVTLGKRKKSRIKVVYMNYRTPGGRIRGNPLKQNQRFQNKFQVAELVEWSTVSKAEEKSMRRRREVSPL